MIHVLRGSARQPAILLAFLAFSACRDGGDGDPGDPVIARAYEQHLRWSDLRQVLPIELTPEDSASMATSYINNWLRQQVLIRKAEQNLADRDKEFTAQLLDYRNSLVIFAYEQALVDQKLDTSIPAEEIEAYHADNKANFELRDNIVRALWFKVREEDRRTMKRLEEHFLSGSPERMSILEVRAAQLGQTITDRSATWSTLGDLRMSMPDLELGELPKEGRHVLRGGEVAYFLDILERREKGAISPVELVRADIRAILINQRKRQLIERMREDLYQEALKNHDIELH